MNGCWLPHRPEHRHQRQAAGRVHFDRGSQPTGNDLVNPQLFNNLSIQPKDDGQLNQTHVFSPNVVNQLVASGMWYSAVFRESTPVGGRLNVLPYNSVTLNSVFSKLGGIQLAIRTFPGRNTTQYQILDDLWINHGNHTLKVGVNFRRNHITDSETSSTRTEPWLCQI